MITIRRGTDRGTTKTPWLNSKHTFSFGSYHDLEHMNFGVLRVINEDRVIPGAGFQAHSHRDMEIISYVLEGSLEHKDSLGTGSIIKPGEVQLMRAGSGITHSEFNPSDNEPIHFLQIWIIPDQKGLEPSYQQKSFQDIRKSGQLTLLVSPGGEEGGLMIHQDVKVYILDLAQDQTYTYPLESNRMAWVQVARGEVLLNGDVLHQGDGAGLVDETNLVFKAIENCEILVFLLLR